MKKLVSVWTENVQIPFATFMETLGNWITQNATAVLVIVVLVLLMILFRSFADRKQRKLSDQNHELTTANSVLNSKLATQATVYESVNNNYKKLALDFSEQIEYFINKLDEQAEENNIMGAKIGELEDKESRMALIVGNQMRKVAKEVLQKQTSEINGQLNADRDMTSAESIEIPLVDLINGINRELIRQGSNAIYSLEADATEFVSIIVATAKVIIDSKGNVSTKCDINPEADGEELQPYSNELESFFGMVESQNEINMNDKPTADEPAKKDTEEVS